MPSWEQIFLPHDQIELISGDVVAKREYEMPRGGVPLRDQFSADFGAHAYFIVLLVREHSFPYPRYMNECGVTPFHSLDELRVWRRVTTWSLISDPGAILRVGDILMHSHRVPSQREHKRQTSLFSATGVPHHYTTVLGYEGRTLSSVAAELVAHKVAIRAHEVLAWRPIALDRPIQGEDHVAMGDRYLPPWADPSVRRLQGNRHFQAPLPLP